MMAQTVKCARFSLSVSMPLPTSSMSGSVKPPGLVQAASGAFKSSAFKIASHVGVIEGPVRQSCPTSAIQSLKGGAATLNTVGRPVAVMAPAILR